VLGPIIIVAVLLVFPIAVFVTGGVFAGILGLLIQKDVDPRYEGTEYVKLA
jgi:hypothetical protein